MAASDALNACVYSAGGGDSCEYVLIPWAGSVTVQRLHITTAAKHGIRWVPEVCSTGRRFMKNICVNAICPGYVLTEPGREATKRLCKKKRAVERHHKVMNDVLKPLQPYTLRSR
jgi:NAD(P)-dependent dehydrogenase (short-subunit alcohol dehydrogenase family)